MGQSVPLVGYLSFGEGIAEMKWPTLGPGEYIKLERAGLVSYEALIEAIKRNGLVRWGDCDYSVPKFAIRKCAKTRWGRIIAMLDHVGFDWEMYTVDPSTLSEPGIVDKGLVEHLPADKSEPASTDQESNWVSTWDWWKVKDGEWTNIEDPFYGIGTLEEMVAGMEAVPTLGSGKYHDVYRLSIQWITDELIAEYAHLKVQMGIVAKERVEDFLDTWNKLDELEGAFQSKGPAYAWYDLCGHALYPATHLVIVMYEGVEGQGIICTTFKDMLDVVAQLNLVAGVK